MFATNRARKTPIGPLPLPRVRRRAERGTCDYSVAAGQIAALYERSKAWRRSRARATRPTASAALPAEPAAAASSSSRLEQRRGMCEPPAGRTTARPLVSRVRSDARVASSREQSRRTAGDGVEYTAAARGRRRAGATSRAGRASVASESIVPRSAHLVDPLSLPRRIGARAGLVVRTRQAAGRAVAASRAASRVDSAPAQASSRTRRSWTTSRRRRPADRLGRHRELSHLDQLDPGVALDLPSFQIPVPTPRASACR